jgi:ATP-dependent exoDNAse (exonuclease V) beta subunit
MPDSFLKKIFNNVVYNHELHKYTVNNLNYKSVTTITKQYVPKFDSNMWSRIIARNTKKTQSQVLEAWEKKAKDGTNRGSGFHRFVEDYFNGVVKKPSIPKQCVRNFRLFKKEFLKDYNIIAVEFVIYDINSEVAGTLDLLLQHKITKLYHVCDWKTNLKYSDDNKYNEYFLAPIKHLSYTSSHLHGLQLTFYRYILEKNTEMQFGDSFVIWINEENKNYKVFKTPYLKNELIIILDYESFMKGN